MWVRPSGTSQPPVKSPTGPWQMRIYQRLVETRTAQQNHEPTKWCCFKPLVFVFVFGLKILVGEKNKTKQWPSIRSINSQLSCKHHFILTLEMYNEWKEWENPELPHKNSIIFKLLNKKMHLSPKPLQSVYLNYMNQNLLKNHFKSWNRDTSNWP